LVGGSAEGFSHVYDDDGYSQDYDSAHTHAITRFNYTVSADNLQFIIGAAEDTFPTQPSQRDYEIHLRGIAPAVSVKVVGQSATLPFRTYSALPLTIAGKDDNDDYYTYDGSTLTVIIHIHSIPTLSSSTVLVQLSAAVNDPVFLSHSGYPGLLQRLISAKIALDNEWGTCCTVYMDDYPTLLAAAQVGDRIINNPQQTRQILQTNWSSLVNGACREINGGISNLRAALRLQLSAQLCS